MICLLCKTKIKKPSVTALKYDGRNTHVIPNTRNGGSEFHEDGGVLSMRFSWVMENNNELVY